MRALYRLGPYPLNIDAERLENASAWTVDPLLEKIENVAPPGESKQPTACVEEAMYRNRAAGRLPWDG